MASRWYPPPGHNQDEVNRITFDNLYKLLDAQNASAAPVAGNNGMSITAAHPAPFQVGNNNYGSLVFKNGMLVGVTPTTSNSTSGGVGFSAVRNSGSSVAPVALTPSGSPSVSTPVPPAPTVAALPAVSDPLSEVGQYVIYQGKPYIFTAGLTGPPGYWALDVTGVPSIRDLWANLPLYPAANYSLGTVFQATDWLVSYAVQIPNGVATWVYYNGIYENTLVNIPTALLGLRDRNLLFRASDYLHNWQWTGLAFSLFAAANNGFSGGLLPTTELYNVGSPPFGGTGALWQAEDGSTVGVSQENGSIVPTIMQVRTNYWFVR